MASKTNVWPKSITVDKRIVKILSESTYDNFPASIKEIITNSYDADASEVRITIDIRKEEIIIEDNGKGMTEEEFDFFLRIAGAKREKDKSNTASNRQMVGKFGVGFLSVFPYFRNYRIESKKKNSDRTMYASIPCYKYFSSGQLVEISEIPIEGGSKIDRSKINESFTRIVVTGFTDLANFFFFESERDENLRHSIRSLEGLEKIKWRLEEDLPLEYEDQRFNILTSKYSPNLSFKVFLNNSQLLRRLYGSTLLEINGDSLKFNPGKKNRELEIKNELYTIGKIKFQYFILTDKKAVRPIEARALKRRNLNVGVGERTAYGLGTEVKGARSRLQWLTGEVLIVEGLNDLINVSRTDFYYDQDLVSLQEFIISRLAHHSTQLEKESEYSREQSETKIKRLEYLEEEPVVKRQMSLISSLSSESASEYKDSKSQEKISKSILFRDKKYNVKVSTWDYKKDFFPACKMEGNKVIINKSYPLFKGVKYTDIFIKLHMLLLSNLNDESINKSKYSKLTKEILECYEEYT